MLKEKCEQIEQSLLKEGDLYLKNPAGNIFQPTSTNNIDTFLHNLVYNIFPQYGLLTYNIKNEYVCRGGRYRSLGDTFRIMHYYNPTITFFDLVKAVVEADFRKELFYFYCKDVGKRVMSREFAIGMEHRSRRDEDELGITENELNTLKPIINEKIESVQPAPVTSAVEGYQDNASGIHFA